MKQKIKQFIQEIGVFSLSLSIAFILTMGVVIVKGWTEPSQNPPGGNLGAPLNTTANSQIKSGPLQVNGLKNIGTTILDGNVGVGTTSPSQKLDVVGYIKGQSGLCIGNDCRNSWPAGGSVNSCYWVSSPASWDFYAECGSDEVVAGLHLKNEWTGSEWYKHQYVSQWKCCKIK